MAAFSLTQPQHQRQAEVRALAREVLAPLAAAGRPGRVNRELVRALGEHGLIAALVPPRQGGEVGSALDLCLLREALARECTDAETALALQGLGGHPIAVAASERVARRWLPAIVAGEAVAAFALSAVFAACAGGIIAYQNIHVAPNDFFKIEYTLQMIIACIIGGTGSVWGPVLGAAVYQLLSTYVWSHFIELHPTVLGLIIIFFIVFLPRGLMELFRRLAAVARGGRFGSDVLLANVRASRLD